MSEEERRRCIITGACAAGSNREEALAEELFIADRGVVLEGAWDGLRESQREGFRRQASYMLAHYGFCSR